MVVVCGGGQLKYRSVLQLTKIPGSKHPAPFEPFEYKSKVKFDYLSSGVWWGSTAIQICIAVDKDPWVETSYTIWTI